MAREKSASAGTIDKKATGRDAPRYLLPGDRMANILEFRAAASKLADCSDRTSVGCSAEIVLFPGVRYERHEDPPPAPKPRNKARRRRDTLTLPD